MNMNFGLMPPPNTASSKEAPSNDDGKKLHGKARMRARKLNRQRAYTRRARADFAPWLAAINMARAAE